MQFTPRTVNLFKSNASSFRSERRFFQVLALALCLSLVGVAAPGAQAQTAVAPTAGDGLTTATAYQITELGNLVWLGERAAANQTSGTYYLLMNDIDASATATWNDAGTSVTFLEGFRPIGTDSSPDTTSFRGVFEGNGKKVSGLTINRPKVDYVGLFGMIGKYGRVQNLTLENGRVSIKGESAGGILAGGSNGRVENCSASGWISHAGTSRGFMTGSAFSGGLVGSNWPSGFLTDCSTSVTVVSPATGMMTVVPRLGGLVGINSGQLVRCFASGPVSGRLAGGLVGYNSGSVERCFATSVVTGIKGLGGPESDESECGGLISNNTGRVTGSFATGLVVTNGNGEDSPMSGGLIGYCWQDALIQSCYATGAVTGTTDYAGGLVGYAAGNSVFKNCFASSVVTASCSSAGGLIGICGENTAVQNCYAIGTVTGATSGAGGLIGFCSGNSMKVQSSYATGAVTAPALYAGGLIGRDEPVGGVTACYWDVETTGRATSAGGTGVMGKTTAEMKQQATFQPGGGTGATDWDFTSVWGIVEGQTYPYLRVESEAPLFRLDVSVTGQGSVTLDPPGGLYAPGTVVTLTAIADAGYHLAEWTGTVTDSHADVTTMALDTHKTVTARFLPCHEIRTLEELQALTSAAPGEYYILMNDLDALATTTWNDAGTSETDLLEGFRPIGTYSSPDTTSFRSIFDGNGKKITGLTINRPQTDYVGLFGVLGNGGEVWNLTLVGASVTGRRGVGGLTGINRGVVTNSSSANRVTGQQYVGGLVGDNNGGKVNNCSATGTITAIQYGGGLVGNNQDGGTLLNSFATGSVTGTGSVQGVFVVVGGLVGYNFQYGIVTNCFATGSVTGQGSGGVSVGGLIGFNSSPTAITNCYATGSATGMQGTIVDVAGLVGFNNGGTLANCFATGKVTNKNSGSEALSGGLIARENGDQVTACYWDVETTGQTTSAGGAGVKGKTTAEMKQQATFQPGGGTGATDWDFTSVWGIVEGETDPFLRAVASLHRLSVAVEGQGTVALSPSGPFFVEGTEVTLTAQPDAGSRFLGWTGTVTDWTTSSTTLVLTGDTTVTARFGRIYEIRKLAELQAIATGDLTGYYTLMNDIDASETATWNDAGTSATFLEGFRPIGTYSSPDTTSFRGVFDGNGKKITGLTINRSNYVGLFGVIGLGGSVKDLTLADGTIRGRNWVGGLVGKNGGSIARVATRISVTGKMGPLGLSPEPKPTSQNVGGLVGDNVGGTLIDCSATGPVTGEAASVPCYTGGLVGYNSGTIGRSSASGRVVGEGPSTSNGGVIFYLDSEDLANRSAAGTAAVVTGNTSVGGLVGNNDQGTLAECFATGAVVGGVPTTIYGNPSVGGLVGFNQAGSVTDCFATGAVTCTTIFEVASNYSSCAGGLIGSNSAAENKVSNCFATGWVTCEGERVFVGGLVGTGSAVKACYWDKETTGQSASAGGAGAIGKTTAQMKQMATFQPGGGTGATDWDFTSVWGIVEGQTYPYLRAVSTEPFQFRLDVSVVGAGSGSVTLDPPGGIYAPGTVVTLTATAQPGSHFADWTGTVADPEAVSTTIVLDTHRTVTARFLRHYEIRTLAELQAMQTGDPEGYYTLMNDIDASATATWNDPDTTVNVLEGFWPIGASVTDDIYDTPVPNPSPWDPTPLPPDPFSFEGVFDGNGKKIVGLTINHPEKRYVGLFRSIGIGGLVKDLTLEGGTIGGGDFGGGVAGWNMGKLIRCVTSGSVIGLKMDFFSHPSTGGLVGENQGLIRSCFATGSLTTDAASGYVGGLVALNSGTIANSFATGEVTKPGLIQTQILYPAGGLVAENTGIIRNCFATGAVAGGNVTGGLVGYNKESGHVVNAYATGLVTGSVYWGGLIGRSLSNPGTVTACYWDVETTSQTTSAGGLGRTSLQMKRKATFLPGWDFTSVWGIVEGKSYPYLKFTAPLYRVNVGVEGNGSVGRSPAGTTHFAGTTLTLTPRAESGYCFTGWTGDVPSGSKPWQVPLVIEIQEDVSLSAHFEPVRHSGVWMVR